MARPLYIVDAFVDGLFTGNPAGVCLLREERSTQWMQKVAAEMNQAETAFLLKQAPDVWGLRWFTPTTEVALCGHATLAAAHALWHEADERAPELKFRTRSGLLEAVAQGANIRLDFPADAPTPIKKVPELLVQLLGGQPAWFGRGRDDHIVVLETADQVRNFRTDDALVSEVTSRGLIVTAPADKPGLDIISRFFAPQVGISEDSVTGSAHCLLSVYWSQRLGKARLQAFQASARTGLLTIEWAGERVYLTGQAHTMLTGEFHG
jgi:PhzF family phenazine biosynthesis protein